MIDRDKEYWINSPIFLKFKDRFDFMKFERVRELKKVFLTERIVEIPFVIDSLKSLDVGVKGKILDVGCAESSLPLYLAPLGYQITGIDVRDYPYRVPNFNFLKTNIMKMPFDDHAFDAVTCVSTLEHVGLGFYSDPRVKNNPQMKAVDEMARVLKDDGVFILTVPFGVASVNKQQRVFDEKILDEILMNFKVCKMKFYANSVQENARNNFWAEVALDEVEKIISNDSTQCVCCVYAKKTGY